MADANAGTLSVAITGDISALLDALSEAESRASAAGQAIVDAFSPADESVTGLEACVQALTEGVGSLNTAVEPVVSTLSDLQDEAKANDEAFQQALSVYNDTTDAFNSGAVSSQVFEASLQQLTDAANSAGVELNGINDNAEEAKNSFEGMAESLVGLAEKVGIGLGLSEIAHEMLDALNAVQQITQSLTFFTGSVQQAADDVELLKAAAIDTHTSFESLATDMQKFGPALGGFSQTLPLLEAAATAAHATGLEFDLMASRLDRMALSGTTNARVLASLQLTVQDLNAATQKLNLGDSFKGLDTVADRVSVLNEVLKKFSGDGVLYAETLQAKWTDFKNEFSFAMEAMAGAIGPLAGEILDTLGGAIQALLPIIESLASSISTGLLSNLNDLHVAISGLYAAVSQDIASPIADIARELEHLTGIDLSKIFSLSEGFKEFTASISGLDRATAVLQLLGVTLDLLSNKIPGDSAAFQSATDAVNKFLAAHQALPPALSQSGAGVSQFSAEVQKALDGLSKATVNVNALKEGVAQAKAALDDGAISQGQYAAVVEAYNKAVTAMNALEGEKKQKLVDTNAELAKAQAAYAEVMATVNALLAVQDRSVQQEEQLAEAISKSNSMWAAANPLEEQEIKNSKDLADAHGKAAVAAADHTTAIQALRDAAAAAGVPLSQIGAFATGMVVPLQGAADAANSLIVPLQSGKVAAEAYGPQMQVTASQVADGFVTITEAGKNFALQVPTGIKDVTVAAQTMAQDVHTVVVNVSGDMGTMGVAVEAAATSVAGSLNVADIAIQKLHDSAGTFPFAASAMAESLKALGITAGSVSSTHDDVTRALKDLGAQMNAAGDVIVGTTSTEKDASAAAEKLAAANDEASASFDRLASAAGGASSAVDDFNTSSKSGGGGRGGGGGATSDSAILQVYAQMGATGDVLDHLAQAMGLVVVGLNQYMTPAALAAAQGLNSAAVAAGKNMLDSLEQAGLSAQDAQHELTNLEQQAAATGRSLQSLVADYITGLSHAASGASAAITGLGMAVTGQGGTTPNMVLLSTAAGTAATSVGNLATAATDGFTSYTDVNTAVSTFAKSMGMSTSAANALGASAQKAADALNAIPVPGAAAVTSMEHLSTTVSTTGETLQVSNEQMAKMAEALMTAGTSADDTAKALYYLGTGATNLGDLLNGVAGKVAKSFDLNGPQPSTPPNYTYTPGSAGQTPGNTPWSGTPWMNNPNLTGMPGQGMGNNPTNLQINVTSPSAQTTAQQIVQALRNNAGLKL